MLGGLALIPLLIVGYILMLQRRRQLVAQYGDPALVRPGQSGRAAALGAVRRHLPAAIFLGALMILIVALARPQTLVSLPRIEGTVILAFDVSGSMAADDLKPTRMEAAKSAARAFVERQPPSVQIGVVSFSEGGFAIQAPTDDQGAVLAAINRLGVQRGTSLASGIQASLNAIAVVQNPPLALSNRGLTPAPSPTPVPKGTTTSAVIVLLTDGENTQAPDPRTAAQAAADRGVRVYTVGIGSAEGATLQLDGFTVRSRLDEATLRDIAQMTGGTYYNAQSETQLQAIYDQLNPQLVIKPQKTEVTALFAGAGILVLLIGGTLSLLWLGRLP
jgi:Ca-activated chloride channel family protein